MRQVPESFDHMLAAWNEKDPKRVRAHLEKALTDDVHFVDPSIYIVGIDGFEANVLEVHERLPGSSRSRRPVGQPTTPSTTS